MSTSESNDVPGKPVPTTPPTASTNGDAIKVSTAVQEDLPSPLVNDGGVLANLPSRPVVVSTQVAAVPSPTTVEAVVPSPATEAPNAPSPTESKKSNGSKAPDVEKPLVVEGAVNTDTSTSTAAAGTITFTFTDEPPRKAGDWVQAISNQVQASVGIAPRPSPPSVIPQGPEYYMNRMLKSKFVEYLECQEPIPFFQDPALVRARKRKRLQASRQEIAISKARRNGRKGRDLTNKRNNKTRKTAFVLSDESEDDEQSTQVNAKEHAHLLTYDWKSLGLGSDLGSVALNRRLVEGLKADPALGRVPQLNATDCLQMVQQLQLATVVPPQDSPLHAVLHQTKQANAKDVQKEDETKGPHWETLVNLYQDMVAQDLDGGGIYRREYQLLKADHVEERMGRVEREAASLQEREDRVRRTAVGLGLLNEATTTQVGAMLGDWRDDAEASDKANNVYWERDFRKLLEERTEECRYLTWHDLW